MILTSRYRPRVHCSIDVLFHAGVLWVTRAVAESREKQA